MTLISKNSWELAVCVVAPDYDEFLSINSTVLYMYSKRNAASE